MRNWVGSAFSATAVGWAIVATVLIARWAGAPNGTECLEFHGAYGSYTRSCTIEGGGLGPASVAAVLFPLLVSLGAPDLSVHRDATSKALLFSSAVVLLLYCVLFVWGWGLLYAPGALLLLAGAAAHAVLAKANTARGPV